MSLPFKKRKLSVPLKVKVDRLAKAVSRNKPDRQQYVFTANVATTLVGYNEQLVDCIPSGLTDTVNGDFIVESVEYRVTMNTTGNFSRGRVDVIVPKASGTETTTGSSDVDAFLFDKSIKSYHTTKWINANSSEWFNPEGKAKLGLVVKRQGAGLTCANNPYVLVRYNTIGSTQVVFTVDVRVTYREK